MGLFGPPRDAKLRAWKSHTYSLCWTAVLTVFLSNRHRRSNPPAYFTHVWHVWQQKENSRNGWVISRGRQGLRQFITGSEVPDKIKQQPVLSYFPILSSKCDNRDESSTGSGVRRLGHQLWSIWTKNWVANRSKPTKREEGARQPTSCSSHSRTTSSQQRDGECCGYKPCLCVWWSCSTTGGWKNTWYMLKDRLRTRGKVKLPLGL